MDPDALARGMAEPPCDGMCGTPGCDHPSPAEAARIAERARRTGVRLAPTKRDFADAPYRITVNRTKVPLLRWRAAVTGQGVGLYTGGPARYGRTRAEALARAQGWCDRDRSKRIAALDADEGTVVYTARGAHRTCISGCVFDPTSDMWVIVAQECSVHNVAVG